MGCSSGKQEVKVIGDVDGSDHYNPSSPNRKILEGEVEVESLAETLKRSAKKATITENLKADEVKVKEISNSPSQDIKIEAHEAEVKQENKEQNLVTSNKDKKQKSDSDSNYGSSYKNKNVILILQELQKILKEAGVNSQDLNIVLTDTTLLYKQIGEKFQTKQEVKFSIVKNKIDISFNKNPYNKLVSKIEELFSKNQTFKEYYGFNWDGAIQEYEKNYLQFKLKKSKEDGTFEDYLVNQEEKNKLIMFFNPTDTLTVKKMMEVSNILDEAGFEFIPIHGESVKGKKEAMAKKEILMNCEINLDMYFMPSVKNPEIKLEKYINFKSNDNMDNVISTAIFIDSKGYIRWLGSPKDMSLEDLVLISKDASRNIKKSDWENLCAEVMKYVEKKSKEDSSRGFIKMKKAVVYSFEDELESFYEPLQVKFEDGDSFVDGLEKGLGSVSLKKYLSHDQFPLPVKLAEKTGVFTNEMENLKSQFPELEDLTYTLILQVKKRYDLNLPTKKDKTKSLDIQLHLPFDKLSHFSQILEAMNIFRIYPLLEKINYYAVTPAVNDTIPEKLSLRDSDSQQDVEVSLSEEIPKVMLIFGYSSKEEERKELIFRLNNINEAFKTKSLMEKMSFIPIFKGESLEQAQELMSEEIFAGKKIHLMTLNSNFPLYFENITYENSSSQIFCIILDVDNVIRYIGTTDDLDIEATLKSMSQGKTSVEKKENLPLTESFMREDFKPEFEDFKSKVTKLFKKSGLNYKPLIELSFQKHVTMDLNGVSDILYKNLKLNLIFKQSSVLQGVDSLKSEKEISSYLDDFTNKYGGFLNVSCLPVKTLHDGNNISTECSACSMSLVKEDTMEYAFNLDSESVNCIQCGESSKPSNPLFQVEGAGEPNIVFCRFNKSTSSILDELIEDFCTLDYQNSPPSDLSCSLCGEELSSTSTFWLSLIHLNEDGKPVTICDAKCFNSLGRNKESSISAILGSLDNEWAALSKLGVMKDRLILKKITGSMA